MTGNRIDHAELKERIREAESRGQEIAIASTRGALRLIERDPRTGEEVVKEGGIGGADGAGFKPDDVAFLRELAGRITPRVGVEAAQMEVARANLQEIADRIEKELS